MTFQNSRRVQYGTNPLDLIGHAIALMSGAGAGQGSLSSYTYPPHNIIATDENSMEIQISVAGFSQNQLEISETNSILQVSGTQEKKDEETCKFVYKGLATRNFTLQWKLPRNVVISDDASIENGILTIKLERITPESEKPRTIKIK